MRTASPDRLGDIKQSAGPVSRGPETAPSVTAAAASTTMQALNSEVLPRESLAVAVTTFPTDAGGSKA